MKIVQLSQQQRNNQNVGKEGLIMEAPDGDGEKQENNSQNMTLPNLPVILLVMNLFVKIALGELKSIEILKMFHKFFHHIHL